MRTKLRSTSGTIAIPARSRQVGTGFDFANPLYVLFRASLREPGTAAHFPYFLHPPQPEVIF
jgi:hypothetical protein